MTSFCVQGGRGGQKVRFSCVRTYWTFPRYQASACVPAEGDRESPPEVVTPPRASVVQAMKTLSFFFTLLQSCPLPSWLPKIFKLSYSNRDRRRSSSEACSSTVPVTNQHITFCYNLASWKKHQSSLTVSERTSAAGVAYFFLCKSGFQADTGPLKPLSSVS